MPRFLPYDSIFLRAAFLRDYGSRNPELSHLDPNLSVNVLLILLRALQVKEIGSPTNMVIIKVRKSDHIVEIALADFEFLPQYAWQVYSEIILVLRVSHRGIIDQNLLPTVQVNSAAIRVSQRIEI